MSSKKKSSLTAEEWQTAFKEFVLEYEQRPSSVYKLAKFVDVPESSFYEYYSSIEALEKDIWQRFHDQTYDSIVRADEYGNYSLKEKYLLYVFTLLQLLRRDRSYLMLSSNVRLMPYGGIESFFTAFRNYVEMLLQEGVERGEIPQRFLGTKVYTWLFRQHLSSVLWYWLKDSSKEFEKTDAFVEKSVRLLFDLVGNNLVDSLLDLSKYVFTKPH